MSPPYCGTPSLSHQFPVDAEEVVVACVVATVVGVVLGNVEITVVGWVMA